MSLQNNLHSESGRSDQIISQFLSKSLHVILEARIPSLSSQGLYREQAPVSRARKRDKWFNLAVGDLPTALENLSSWHRNVMDPMIIDVILLHKRVSDSSFDDIYAVPRITAETIIERWVVQHEFPRTVHASDHQNSYKTYKKSIILLRSLYSTLRLLPAYQIFRKLSSSNQIYSFNVSYRVSSFTLPFSRKEEENMKIFTFTPIETSSGRLCVSVTYRSALSDLNLEAPTAFPPQIIADYVGSPAAEQLKVFPSNKIGGAISVPIKMFQGHDYKPLGRPHSWTSGIHKAAILQRHPLSVSPSPPMPSDHRSAPFEAYPDKCMSYKLSAYKTGASLDEYRLSPPFSSSPSPSPPTQSSSVHSLKARLRSESVPVSIPLPIAGRVGSRYLNPISSDPNRSLFPPPSPRSAKCDPCSHDSSSENRLLRRQDTLKSRELHAGNSNLYGLSGNKMSKDARDDSGRFSGVGSSSDSPMIDLSRSSSISFQDDLDDCDFACPFAVDDVDISEVQTRNGDGKISSESSYSPVRKSQDAAVGMLVEMLKTAAPLRQDSFSSQSSKSQSGPETTTSGIFPSPRKTEDALKELQIYREMKDFILSQSSTQLLGSVKQRTL